MGGGLVDVESRTTVVLIGKTGNGKSATANSIIGRRSFTSRASSSGVTTCCELQTTVLQNGRTVNVIDTPGLFDFSDDTQQMAKEITNCLQLVEDGVHALILVLSVRTRFSKEEEGAVKCLKEIFGEKILDYMIIVFTGGDQLEDDEMLLEDYLNQCPPPLKELLSLCEERIVLFNNKTKNEKEKARQVNELFMFVDLISEKNDGKPYTDSLLAEVKEAKMKLDSMEYSSKTDMNEYKNMIKDLYEEQLKHVTELVEKKMNLQVELLKKQLDDEKIARERREKELKNQLNEEKSERIKVEKIAEKRNHDFQNEMKHLNEKLRIAEIERNKCIIM